MCSALLDNNARFTVALLLDDEVFLFFSTSFFQVPLGVSMVRGFFFLALFFEKETARGVSI
jgi:uncharacterized membrane protein YobD (UPF0266 family)